MAHFRSNGHIAKRLLKIEDLFDNEGQDRSFVFRHLASGVRVDGREMTLVDFQANAGADITFTAGGSAFTVSKANITIINRLRTKRYLVDASAVTII